MQHQRPQRHTNLNPTRNPQHARCTRRAPHQPTRSNRAPQKQYHSRPPPIPLHVMQREQFRIAHQISIRTRQHINRQFIEAQQPRSSDLHPGLEGERGEERDDFDVFDYRGRVSWGCETRGVVGDLVCGYEGGGEEEQQGLDEVDCAEIETVLGDAVGGDQGCGFEGCEGAEEEGRERDEGCGPGVRVGGEGCGGETENYGVA